LRLYFKVKDQEFPIKEINNYLKDFSSSSSRFRLCVPVLEEGGFSLVYPDHDSLQADSEALDDIKLFFYDIGFRGAITTKLHEEKEVKPVEVERKAMPKREAPVEEKKEAPVFNKTQYKPRSKAYTDVVIDDLVDTLYNVKFTGQIFKVEEKVTRTNMIIQTVYVKDKDNAVIVKVVENRRFTKEELAKNKEGKYANFYGNYRFDTFANGYIFEVDQIEFIDVDTSFHDDEEEKRIELHCHTNRSEMDGVCDAEELVQAAFSMGHDAIAITDHLDVQAFPTAQKAANKLMKGTDRLFKIIYGCEMNMVDSRLNLVYNPVPLSLADAEYCVLDFETTGLSTRHDYIIEFGASILYKGIVKQKKDLFVKPPITVPQKIKELTNITDAHLASAKPFKECYQEIMDFIGDRVIVAHNAAFDFGFLNEEMKRNGLKELTNPVIDTLDLARSLFSNRRSYRLGNIARQYSVSYDEVVAHRADYDAEVLAQVFHLMLKDVYKLGIHDLMELSEYHTEDAFIKNREYHTNVLVKNKQGLKDLFKLVSISNTTQLAVFGKANTKSEDSQFVVEPRIFRETLNEYRENLLLGSACCNGEVFEIASTRNKEALAKAISFYDFIEVQPLENYRHLLERGSFDEERLKQYLRDIIDEAKAQNKIIVATGDVHYARPEQKILRDVYINAQGIGGVHHPLFIYDKERRKRQVSPDQHFRNTREMLDAFAWLKDDALVKDIVVHNTHKIADMIEVMTPIHDKLYTPVIEGSNDKLTQIVYETAHERYGEVLDPIIEERIKKELDSIIGNGYGVIYYVSYLLVKKSNEDGYLVGSRGSVGSSLVATFSGISECNPLPPHYICPKCKKLIWRHDTKSGYNLPYMNCPDCGERMKVDGQDIPFETFLGFHGDKVPDIDLNFSDQYQDKAHLFLRSVFGEDYVFRAGTISTVAEKTAFGYVSGYCEEKEITNMSRAQRQRLASGCEGVKRTTGQHPGGIIVIPNYMNVFDFTPYQYPANNPDSVWRTTHFDFHEIHDNVLKFDILGHVDPTAMKLLQDISGIDVKTIPMNDPKVMSIFSSPKELGIVNPKYDEATGACGLPEFGTRFVRGILQETKPKNFSELVQISGLSHGTDVWNNNAKDLVDSGIALADVIGCRDDIMSDMLHYGLEPKDAFDIMENVRKGKVANGKCDKWPDYEQKMLDHNVPKWYIESCKKIKYMFPKAHAVAYVIMAVRVAWFKVYHPEYYYVSFFSLRCDAYEIETMIKDADSIKARLDEIGAKLNSREDPASKKEKDIYDTLEISYEMASRGYRMSNIDLNRSLAKEFLVNPEDHHEIIPPFKILDGLGDNVAVSIVEARNERPFLSKEDLVARTQISQTLLKKMESLGVLKDLDDSNQISLF
ncbi:MAG: PolC-type DNA polymerase III, partial [Erysipelotrichaceae bacterium]|nr:PolC-type DNA polymerase III [Erysipelotrichaceae bacterium]